MIKRKNKKSRALLGSFLILLGVFIPISKYFYYYCLDSDNDKEIETFFINDASDVNIENNDISLDGKKETITYNYIAVLEIPSISLKRGLVDKNSYANNVSKNIQILKESDMPDVKNGTMYLASHSGTGYISFFRNLDKINESDLVYVYYNNIKYVYKVTNIYEEVKDGDISINKEKNKTRLILTTCSQKHKGNQIVVITELINQENY